jgi:ATP-binding cassette subfamily B protein
VQRRLRHAAGPVLRLVRNAAPRAAAVVLVTQTLSAFAATAVLMLANEVLVQLFGGGPIGARIDSALPALALLAAAYLAQAGLGAATLAAQAHLVPAVHRHAEEALYAATLGVDLAAFDDPTFYDRLHRARDRGVMHIEGATGAAVEIVSALSAVAGTAVALFLLHPLLPLVLTIGLMPEGWAALQAARMQYEAMPTTISLMRRVEMLAHLATERDPAPEIRANQTQAFVLGEYRRCAVALQEHMVRIGLRQARAATWGRLSTGLGFVLTFIVLGLLLERSALDLAMAGTAVVALRSAGAAIAQLMRAGNEIIEKGLYISDYAAFLEDAGRRSSPAQGEPAPVRPGCIVVDHVSFCYPGSDRRSLDDVSLTIEPGQTVALVGENGSGKTTLAKLIAGLYAPSAGCITWDGVDLQRMSPESRADRVAVVQQHPVRWPRTAEENVRLGRQDRLDPDREALRRAAGQARADEVVSTLPRGWSTLLSREFQGGHDLSTGQWQRLAVARGLYRDAPLVIWDEPTAPLDPKAEYAVYESLRKVAHDRTAILITHRLASIRHADRIFLLESGRLVEEGTHEDLLRLNGRYAGLYRLQASLHDLPPEDAR